VYLFSPRREAVGLHVLVDEDVALLLERDMAEGHGSDRQPELGTEDSIWWALERCKQQGRAKEDGEEHQGT